MSRWVLAFSISFVFLTVMAIAGLRGLFNLNVKPLLEKNQATQQKHFTLYREDIAFLNRIVAQKRAFLAASDEAADAGPVLNAKLMWTPANPADGGSSTPLVSVESRETLLRFGTDWMKQHKKALKIKADLSILSQIMRFDHWDLEQSGPIANVIKSGKFVPPPQLPIPETSDLLAATQLRLMKGADDGEPLRALREVRKLGELLLTTENLQLVLAGIAVLDHERRAYRYYVDEQGLDATAWTPIDRNMTRRANRAVWGTRGYIHMWTPPELLDKAFLGEIEPIGFCAAVNEAFPLEFTLRPLLQPYWPFELDFRENYTHLDKVYQRAEKSCRLRYLKQLVATGNFRTHMPGPFLFNRLPYSRKVFGMRYAVVNFTGFDAYNALAAKGTVTQ